MRTHSPQQPPRLSERQLRRLETLPDDYRVVSARDGSPIVESPTGQTLRLQPNGRLAATNLIDRVQSYLRIESS